MHGDTEAYPTAEIELCLGGTKKTAKVAVAPVSVLLGQDVYDIRGGWKLPEMGLLAEIRTQKRCQEEARREETAQLDEKGSQPRIEGGVSPVR